MKYSLLLACMLALMPFCFQSCRFTCEPFDIKRIDTSKVHFYDSYVFVNENDTIKLELKDYDISLTKRDYYGVCEPTFWLLFTDSTEESALYYDFVYHRTKGAPYSSTVLRLKLYNWSFRFDQDFIQKASAGEIKLDSSECFEVSSSSKRIKTATLKNLSFSDFETIDGKIWVLKQVGAKLDLQALLNEKTRRF